MADGLSARDLAGKFAFRFSGFSMKNSILFYLAGVGQFEIAADGKLQRRSQILPHPAPGAEGQARGWPL